MPRPIVSASSLRPGTHQAGSSTFVRPLADLAIAGWMRTAILAVASGSALLIMARSVLD